MQELFWGLWRDWTKEEGDAFNALCAAMASGDSELIKIKGREYECARHRATKHLYPADIYPPGYCEDEKTNGA